MYITIFDFMVTKPYVFHRYTFAICPLHPTRRSYTFTWYTITAITDNTLDERQEIGVQNVSTRFVHLVTSYLFHSIQHLEK